jgi:hypothetical protein
MTAECIIEDIRTVRTETKQTLESYEQDVNKLLDAINQYRKIFEDLNTRQIDLNSKVRNTVCGFEEATEIVKLSHSLIGEYRRLFAKARGSNFYSGYKSILLELSATVDDFEEYLQDFKFRHDKDSQSEMQGLLKGFTLSL